MNVRSFLRTRWPNSCPDEARTLKRCLGTFDLIFLGVGAIIGTGIFVLTGTVAATHTGPAIVVSFVIAGIACGFSALSYAELASSVGGCGSSYGYCYAAFGELPAWVVGWALIMEYGVAVSLVAVGWSSYFRDIVSAIGFQIPQALSGALAGGTVDLPAVAIVLIVMVLLMIGVSHSTKVNNAAVMIKILALVIFVAVAFGHINPDNWVPFAPFGWTGIVKGAAGIFLAYVGFDVVATAAEETKDPEKSLPRAIIGSLVIVTVAYIVVAAVLTGIVSYQYLNVGSPVSHALQLIGFRFASGLVAAGAIAGMTTVIITVYYGFTRVVFAMARDGLLPDGLSLVTKNARTPAVAIAICGIPAAFAAGLVPLDSLAGLVSIGTLLAFFMVCLSVARMRYKHPDLKRPFKTPFGIVIPVLGMISCASLAFMLSSITLAMFVLWQSIGLAVYLGYSVRHSGQGTKQTPD